MERERAQIERDAAFKKIDYLHMLFEQVEHCANAHTLNKYHRAVSRADRKDAFDRGNMQAYSEAMEDEAQLAHDEAVGGYTAAAVERLIKLTRQQLLQLGKML